jgi:hypothetical protein
MPQISATTSVIASARNEMSVSTVSTIAMPSSRWPGGRRSSRTIAPRHWRSLAVYDLLGALFVPPDLTLVSGAAAKLFKRVCDIVRDRFADPAFGPWAGIGNLAERLPRAKHLPAMNEAGGVVEANRLDEAAAGGVVRREELLQVSQRDPGLGRRFPALPTTRILPGGSAAGSVVRRDPVPEIAPNRRIQRSFGHSCEVRRRTQERASTANDTDRGRPMSNTPVDLSATDVSFAIIEALRPWSSAVYRGKGCAGAQREDVEHGRRRSNKVQVKDLMPYSPTLAPSRSHHAFRL